MISKLILKNFQKHQKLVINFSPEITTIQGRNDKGKSAVLRAIRWVSLNKPSRKNFTKWGEKLVTAKIIAEDNAVKRVRGKKNSYVVNDNKLEAFAAELPDSVYSVLNMSEYNFQKQHDSAFWFSDSPGEISKKINEIVDLSIIDKVLYNLNGQVRKAKTAIEITAKQVEESREKLRNLAYIKEYSKDFKELEIIYESYKSKKEKTSALQSIMHDLFNSQKIIKKTNSFKGRTREILSLGNSLSEKERYVRTLQKLLKQIKELKSIDISSCFVEFKELSSGVKKLEKLNKRDQILYNTCLRIATLLKDHKEYVRIVKQEKEKLGKYERCPLCGTELKNQLQ